MEHAVASLLVPLLNLFRTAWDSKVLIPFDYPEKVAMVVVGP